MGPDEQDKPAAESPDAPTEEPSNADAPAAESNAFSNTLSYRSSDAATPGLTEKNDPTNRTLADPPRPSDRRSSEPVPDAALDPPADLPLPESVGRYAIRTALGKGGFGAVYKAYDAQLERHVAVKVPLLRGGVDSDDFLQEARTVDTSIDRHCL